MNRAPSSHVLCSRVRTLSVTILSQERRTFLAVGTLGRLLAKSSSPGLAFISLFRSPALLRMAPASLPRWIRLPPVARLRRSLRLLSPFDAYRCTLTRPSVRPCGLTSTGWVCLSQLFSCRASASRVSCWIVHGHPTFRGFSPPTADTCDLPLAWMSRCQSSVSFPALRRRDSEDFSLLADAFSDDSVVHATEGSLLSWSFSPLRG